MKEVSVEEILEQYNLIVPEIQREYVWGLNQYGVFETFLKDLKEGIQTEGEVPGEIKSLQETIDNPLIDEVTKNNLRLLLEGMRKPKVSMNIGFLYSYKPGYYIGNDRDEDLYLIDGQQRFTTLFLILFYFALKEQRKEEFLQLFKFDFYKEKIGFDYRVRAVTYQFIIDLIHKCENVQDLLDVRHKRWFLATYANDTTIKSITGVDEQSGVFNIQNKHFDGDNQEYYDYIKKYIKFWHFKTEETSQGEELYITMNSRGQQLADNETIRARLFDNDDVRANSLYWSEQWEIWQDFFWKHRNKKQPGMTADEGFNEFLRWVQLLKMWQALARVINDGGEAAKKFENVLQWEEGSKLDVRYIDLEDIELTFKAVLYAFEEFPKEMNSFKVKYPKSYKTGLISNEWISTTGRGLDLIALFQLLPLISYLKNCIGSGHEINSQTFYRLLRTVNTLSKDTTIRKAVRNRVANVLIFTNAVSPVDDILIVTGKPEISKQYSTKR